MHELVLQAIAMADKGWWNAFIDMLKLLCKLFGW
jgi:hypothetical protein